MSRTASGRWRAVNMMRSAPTKGAHVISESTGSLVIVTGSARPVLTVGGLRKARMASSPPPLGPDEEQQDAEGDPIDIVLRLPALDAPHEVAGAQRPRGQEVQHAVHEVTVDPADQA